MKYPLQIDPGTVSELAPKRESFGWFSLVMAAVLGAALMGIWDAYREAVESDSPATVTNRKQAVS